MENPENWRRLGAAVQGRRNRLGLTQEEITERGGPSHSTLRRLERGDPGPYQGRTLVSLEQALDWRSGTVQAILEGTAGVDPTAWVDTSVMYRDGHNVLRGGPNALDHVFAAAEAAAGSAVDPALVLARDTAVRALLDYSKLLEAADDRTAVINMARVLMDIPQSAAEQDAGD